MTRDEQRQYREAVGHAMQQMWYLHYEVEEQEQRFAKRVDSRIGTILAKLEELQEIIREQEVTA